MVFRKIRIIRRINLVIAETEKYGFAVDPVNLQFPVGQQNRDEGDPLFWTKKVRDPSLNSGYKWEFRVYTGIVNFDDFDFSATPSCRRFSPCP